ncbi:MAG: hypothetical protein ABL904_14000 [Hyphomicrobiaceae bacterium]
MYDLQSVQQAAYYITYIALSMAITVWVGRTLNRNGRVFLYENFEGREALADSVNHLLLVGFYLINIGFMALALRFGGRPVGLVESIEYLSTKIGLVVVVIGVMHFNNMYALIKLRKSSLFNLLMPKAPPASTVGTTALA